MPTNASPADQMLSARLAHLSMIQGIVSRLATFSANAKNFCVTVVAALLGIAFQQHLPSLLISAAFVVISFASLDVYYLAQERRFRGFYRGVASRPLADAAKLDLTPAKLTLGEYLAGICSFSTGGFYLLLLIVGAALLPTAYGRTDETGLGHSSRAAGSASAQRAGESTALAARQSANGRGQIATDKSLRDARPNGTAVPRVGAQRPVRPSAAGPSAEGRDVRQPLPVTSR